MNTLTDEEMARGIDTLARAVLMAAENLDARQPNASRCNCNAWGKPGLCAHHSYAFANLREAAMKLQHVRDYLAAGQVTVVR